MKPELKELFREIKEKVVKVLTTIMYIVLLVAMFAGLIGVIVGGILLVGYRQEVAAFYGDVRCAAAIETFLPEGKYVALVDGEKYTFVVDKDNYNKKAHKYVFDFEDEDGVGQGTFTFYYSPYSLFFGVESESTGNESGYLRATTDGTYISECTGSDSPKDVWVRFAREGSTQAEALLATVTAG